MKPPIRRLLTTGRPLILLAALALLCAGCATDVLGPVAPKEAAAVQNCMQDEVKDFTLNCEANDVGVSQYILVGGPTECLPGQIIKVQLQAELEATSKFRYDVGLFVAQDGGDGLKGSCFRDFLPPPLKPAGEYDPGTKFNPANPTVFTGGGPFLTAEDAADTCGDIQQDVLTYRDLGETPAGGGTGPVWVDVMCQDKVGPTPGSPPDGIADVGTCVSWDNLANATPACTSVADAKPGAPPKCNCTSVQIAGLTVPKVATIEVKKALVPATDPGKFDLLIDGEVRSGSDGVGDKGSTGAIEVSAGTSSAPGATHTVAEAAHPGSETSIDSYDVSYYCTKNGAEAAKGTGPGPASLNVQPDDEVICTFTNQRKPRLVLVKELINDNGGTAEDIDWTLEATGARTDGPTNLSGKSPVDSAALWPNFKPDTYTLSETYVDGDPGVPNGYASGPWNCLRAGNDEVVPVSSDGKVVIAYGDDVTCTITNDDIQPKLKLVKKVVNAYGGTATAADFEASVVAGGVPTDMPWDTFVGLNAGTYDANETGPTGYMASEWEGDCEADGEITLLPGDEMTCTVTNSDIQPKLKLVKTIVNQYGGAATIADFQATLSDGKNRWPVPWGAVPGLKAGTYDVDESGPAGYAASAWGGDCDTDGKITLEPGDDKTCTVTNSDVQPKLKLVKKMDIQYGGAATAADFQASVFDGTNSTNVAWNTFVGLQGGRVRCQRDRARRLYRYDMGRGLRARRSGDPAAR